MSTERFNIGKQFCWQNETYEVRRLLSENNVNISNVQTGETQTVAFSQLVKALFANEIQFIVNGQLVKHTLQNDYRDLSDYPDVLRAVAEYRLGVIRPLLRLPPHKRRKEITKRVRELKEERKDNNRSLQNALSVATIYRWLGEYIQSGEDIRVLIPNTTKRGGARKTRLKAEVEAIIKTVIEEHYLVREKRTLDYICREIAVRIEEENLSRISQEQLKTPSRTTVFRRITGLDEKSKCIAKRGKRTAKRKLTQYGATSYPTMPLERVEIDHTCSDIIVVDENDCLPLGRLTLTFCLDTATRYPLGHYLSFEPPSYLSVLECLRHTICPKPDARQRCGTEHNWIAYGIPYTLVIDNGKEFVGQDLRDACTLLGIILQRTPVKTPYFKAAVERMFGTLNTGLLHTLPGTTFSNMRQRGDYNSLKQACISLNDLDKMIHLFLVDIYAENFHRGLQGIPARCWEEATRSGFFPRVPSSAKELDILLGRVAYRTIQPYGIELHSLRYNCSSLTLLRTRMAKCRDRHVKIKYHPSDLSSLYVYDPEDKQYIHVPALAQEYTQKLSLWKHKVIRNFVLSQQETVDIVALGRAQRKIQAIVEQSLQRKKLSTRSKIARWQESGKTGDSQEVDVTTANESVELEHQPLTNLDLDLEELEKAGWGVSYDLPFADEGATQNDN